MIQVKKKIINGVPSFKQYWKGQPVINYNPSDHDYSKDYLTFDILTSGTLAWTLVNNMVSISIAYSINGGDWVSWSSSYNGNPIQVQAGDTVRLRGGDSRYAYSNTDYNTFGGSSYSIGTATFNVEGNIMSLIYGDNFVGKTTMSGTYNFCSMFKWANVVSAENLILPATTLTDHCYRAMFSKSPTLVVAPQLPATTLAQDCYQQMFFGCTSLTTAPELPATTLANYCYQNMFQGCTSLTTAPALPATTLVRYCYRQMFYGCTNLNNIECRATDISAPYCLYNWVQYVAATGTFVKKAGVTYPSGNSGIPSGWTVVEE